ncbi:UNVERIFIED_CONTAM: hypothetical protein Sangu_2201900 [Sesamum angustifolium]|uniref:Uncharacterized protein n=1 Tax=Sesamum angustifolium TaxID=2727405 RepID=A0AAW2LJI7_9LAMI
MATPPTEVLENPTLSADLVLEQNHDNPLPQLPNHGGMEPELVFSEEEVRGTLEASASTGKYWQDWEKLRSMLSYHLKQVLSEYPEAKMTNEQIASLGETFQELVKKILLAARSIYPKLSKLSLALEKNLLVTSTLTISSDPSPLGTEQNSNGSYEGSGSVRPPTNSVENGIEPPVRDKDEIMAEVQEAEVGEDMTIDMETIEDIVRSSEVNPTPDVDHSNT